MGLVHGMKRVVGKWAAGGRGVSFSALFREFQNILDRNNRVLELMADMGDKLNGEYIFDQRYIRVACEQLTDQVFKLISELHVFSGESHVGLFSAFDRIQKEIEEELAGKPSIRGRVWTWDLDLVGRDLDDEVGPKSAKLGEARNILGLTTPDGFVITALAYKEYLRQNGLSEILSQKLEDLPWDDETTLAGIGKDLHQAILKTRMPRDLDKALSKAYGRLAKRQGVRPRALTLAVRSSALEEDGETSFAGQYQTMLNVRPQDLADAYRQVLASAFNAEAWFYRRQRHPEHPEGAMAVGVLNLVDARVSGALISLDPSDPDLNTMLVSAVWGLGASLVEGRQDTDHFRLSRRPPFSMEASQIGQKRQRLALLPEGGVAWTDVPEQLRSEPCLNPTQLAELARMARQVEQYFKRPQEIEWAYDQKDRLIVLQIRPLRMPLPAVEADRIQQVCRGERVVFSQRGLVAQRGVASGRVVMVRPGDDLDGFPFGAILVTRSTSPRLVKVMPKAQGIITDIGSPTGHMAAMAREYRVPTLVNTGVATRLLHDGQEITLDAVHRVVYQGLIKELSCFEMTEESVFEESREYRMLSRMLKKIAPLNLIDPYDSNFNPSSCQTLHDISRYIHETAVRELIELSRSRRLLRGASWKRLKTRLPLGLGIIDIHGGCAAETKDVLEPGDLCCVPLLDLLYGMEFPGLWTSEPISVDLGSFMSSFTRTVSGNLADPRGQGRNLAVISKEYLNLSLRLGYHYTMVDAYLSGVMNDNTIFFRFVGGVSDIRRRSRRTGFIADVLERFDFRTEVHGDLVVGRLKKFPEDRMRRKMRLLGALIAYTRQLDVLMDDDDRKNHFFQDFLEKINHFTEVEDERLPERLVTL